MSSQLSRLEGRWAFLRQPGAWLWTLFGLGVLLRGFLVLGTEGTTDVAIWDEHAGGVARYGLIVHYRVDEWFNHPPPVARVMAWLWKVSQATGVPFRVLYRGPIALVDLASGALLVRVLAGSPYRWLAFGAYCVAPAAVILSGHHGNTDSLVAFCLIGCTLLAAARRPVACGAVIGASLWIKLPGLIAAPAIGFAFARWRDRMVCAATALAVGAAGYLPALLADAPIVWRRVFGYRGLYLESPGGVRIWGVQNLLLRGLGGDPSVWPGWARWYILHDTQVALVLIVLFAWLRRRHGDAAGLAATIAGCYALFYGLVNAWAFQYLAWSIPFWFAAGALFAVCANLIAGTYLYGLYAYLCGDALLRGKWDFVGHASWPAGLLVLRDLAVLTYLLFGLTWLGRAAWDEGRRRRVGEKGRRQPSVGV